jgi:prepilin-type N-terminal cleavage/methylation domain-containing protein
MNLRRQQSGFTLIEIAIVLVIIGLLLGGILKGQELITSARVRNLADQSNGIQAAYYGFVDRFRNLPGDWAQAAAVQAIPNLGAAANGDGDGQIDSATWTEPRAAWEQLSRAGFISGTYTAAAAAPTADADAPRNAFNGFVTLSHSADYAGTAPTVRLNLSVGNQVPVGVMRELDVKIDDGRPEEGTFRAALSAAAALGATVQGAATCTDATTPPAVWNIAGDDQSCNGIVLY